MASEYGTYESRLELIPAATYTADLTGTAFDLKGKQIPYMIVCEYTDKKTDASDTMDVYIDILCGTTWMPVMRFTTALGNGTDSQIETGFLGGFSSNTTVTNVSAALASGAIRPGFIGEGIRARLDFTDGGGGGVASFTLSVLAYCL